MCVRVYMYMFASQSMNVDVSAYEYVFMLCWDVEAQVTTHLCLKAINNVLVY